MNISFILLTWNSDKYIAECLNSIITDLKNKLCYEIFIVDNGSKDNTVQILSYFKKKYPDNIIPIYLKSNTGTTYSRNLALKRATGRFIVIMDSDVTVFPGNIEQLINNLQQNKKAGMFVPKLLYPNGNLQKSIDIFPTIFTKIFRYLFLKKMEKRENSLKPKTSIYPVDYAISAMWVLKRETIEKVGLLDENIFYAPEDVDYCMRIWKAGYSILYNPNISCVHHTQEISRGIKINAATFHHIRGLFYYFKKHNYIIKRPKNFSKSL